MGLWTYKLKVSTSNCYSLASGVVASILSFHGIHPTHKGNSFHHHNTHQVWAFVVSKGVAYVEFVLTWLSAAIQLWAQGKVNWW